MTRREAILRLGSASLGARVALAQGRVTPPGTPLAPGAPSSPERTALIDAFKRQSDGVENTFEARTHKSDLAMPYRLFRPKAADKLPLLVYLHGSGGLGSDNERQLGLGNIFGTRVWALPGNQQRFPCYVVAPQTDRGWNRYDFSKDTATMLPGLGDGSRLALEIVDRLSREFPIDERRIYVTGQSMGGAGVWNVLANRPTLFAAAIVCCGSASTERGTEAIDTPLWSFHGDADRTVPVSVSRDRVAARRTAGGHPLYTEYAGVDHNSWEWAYTEPELATWLFAQRRAH
jgi:predicted peptidase